MKDDARAELARMSIKELTDTYGQPYADITYEGSLEGFVGRPMLADDNPAVMAAIGRCAVARIRFDNVPGLALGAYHPGQCGWCEYPLEELLKACNWSVYVSRRVQVRRLTWYVEGEPVVRGGPVGDFLNPDYAAFAAKSPYNQTQEVERVIASTMG